tara:strand:+ start:1172 stop:2110 length:939 start_codon:yes stop_codon:yes gene_type:complete
MAFLNLKNTVVYDTYTAADGTKYIADYTGKRTRIFKEDADGNKTVISSSKRGFDDKGANRKKVGQEFDTFVSALQKAEAGEQLTYTDDDVASGRGGFLQKDTASKITLSDGTVLASAAGDTSNEIKNLKALADEVGAVSISNKPKDEQEVDTTTTDDTDTRITTADAVVEKNITDETKIDLGDSAEADVAETALEEVGIGSAQAFGGDIIGDLDQSTSSFTDTTSILGTAADRVVTPQDRDRDTTTPPTMSTGTAAGGEMEKDAAISVAPAEDEAIDFYTSGRRSTIMTSPGGLLTDEEDPALRRRRSLIAS